MFTPSTYMHQRTVENQTLEMENKFSYANDLPDIRFKEYGRNVQKIAEYILQVEDREKRTKLAYTLIELMRQLNPNVTEASDYYQKLWDHLFIITDFKLDVDAPFPVPDRTILDKKPEKVPYGQHTITFRHYGYQIEALIKHVCTIENAEEREAAAIYIGKLMKMFYQSNNKEILEDSVIVEHIKKLSNGQLVLSLDKIQAENLLNISQDRAHSQGGNWKQHGGRRDGGNRRRDNKRRKY